MNEENDLSVRELSREQLPWALLLEADPSRAHVETYIDKAVVLGLFDATDIVAVVALLARSTETVEVMSIAVAPQHRGKGLGKKTLSAALERAQTLGARLVVVGTGNSSLDQLAFYQKAGFRMEAIERDYFVRHYPEPIVENGIVCRDMVRLSLELKGEQ
jgi:ribosomal protein S18 acetylase RimI-like enzyme